MAVTAGVWCARAIVVAAVAFFAVTGPMAAVGSPEISGAPAAPDERPASEPVERRSLGSPDGIPPGTIFEYVSPKPGVVIDPAELRAHDISYAGGERSPSFSSASGLTPMAAPTDYSHGDHKGIAILAAFSDVTHSAFGKTYYEDKLNYNGTSRSSSKTFWYLNSYGNYTLNFTVTDWVTLPQTQAYYDGNTQRLVGDAAVAANAQVDFSQFDWDGDGWVDNLMIVHSGGDQAAGCSPNCIWSHMSYGNQQAVDGVRVSPYATVADFGYPSGDSLGVFIHEYGHLGFGLPDLYDQNYENDGLSIWDMMAGGSWSMSHLSTWCKEYLGWVDPFVPTFNVDYTIYPATDPRYNPVKVTTNYTNEYFLIEMRADTGNLYDGGIPYNGLVIYHVDTVRVQQGWSYGFETVYPSAGSPLNHKAIDIEENGNQDLDVIGGGGHSNDVWVSNALGFNPTSTPNTNLYVNNNAYATGIHIWNISAVLSSGGSHMTFSINTGRINLLLSGRTIGSPEKSGTPGTSVVYPVEFSTASAAGDTVTLSIEGVNQTLGSIDRASMTLAPFGSQTVNLSVAIPSSWSANEPAWVQVRATSTTDSRVSFLVSTISRAAQFYGIEPVGITNLDFWAPPDVTLSKDFTVRNLGNGLDNISVSVTADPAQLIVGIVTQPGYIGQGGSTAVPVGYTVQHDVLYGTAIPVSFNLRYGEFGSYQYLTFTTTVYADKLSIVTTEVQAFGTKLLDPGVPFSVNITIHNLGNYASVFNLSTSSPEGTAATFDVAYITVPAFSDGVIGARVLAGFDTEAGTAGLVFFTVDYEDLRGSATANLSIQVKQRYELALSGETAFQARPGANVQFDLVALNNGNGRDNVTLSFAPAFVEWNATLSAPTLSLDTSLQGRAVSFVFRASVPPTAAGNLQQTFVITMRSTASGIYANIEVTVLVLPVYAFDAEADPAQGPISGTESATFVLSFNNRGNVRDSYSVTIDGLPEGWTTEFAEGGIATVSPRGTGQATLIVRPAAGAPADRYDFQIFISSEGNLSRPLVIPLNVTINAYREISVRATPVSGEVRPGATVTLEVVIRNLGNVRESVFLQTTGSFGSVSVDPLQVYVPAYEEKVVHVVVTLKDDQPAGMNALVIQAQDVNVASVTAETTVEINVAEMPAAPPTTPGFEGVLAVVAVISIAAVAALARRRRE